MGLLKTIGRGFGRMSRRLAMRSRWLARRLWVVMVADVALTSRRHWKRLDSGERNRLVKLARKSKGQPSKNLSSSERGEATELLDKLGHIELAGDVATIVLPFKPFSRLATRIVAGRQEKAKKPAAELPS